MSDVIDEIGRIIEEVASGAQVRESVEEAQERLRGRRAKLSDEGNRVADFVRDQLDQLFPGDPNGKMRLLREIVDSEEYKAATQLTDETSIEVVRRQVARAADEEKKNQLANLKEDLAETTKQYDALREEYASMLGVKLEYCSFVAGLMVCFGPSWPADAHEATEQASRCGRMRPSEKLRYLAGGAKRLLADVGPSTPDRGAFAKRAHEVMGHQRLVSIFRWREEDVASCYNAKSDAFNLYALALARMHAVSEWARTGHNVFELTHALAVGLALTDAPDDAVEASPLPYPAMVLRVPPGVLAFRSPDGSEAEQRWVDTIWVVEYEADADDADGNPTGVTARQREIVPLHDGVAADSRVEEIYAAARNLVSNFLLWLEATGGHRAHKQDKVPVKLAEKRARSGETWPREWVFGKEVSIAPEMKRAAAEAAAGSGRHAVMGWKVRARFIVRGHWRNQAHGAGRQLRTRKWIQPFWKGPKGEAAWSHLYVAKEQP